MLPSVECALAAPHSHLVGVITSHKIPGRLTQQRRPISGYSGQCCNDFADGRVSTSASELAQRLGRRRSPSKLATKAAAAGTFSYPTNDNQNGGFPKRGVQNAAMANKLPKVEVFAKGKWRRIADSSLNDEDEPLPLPMTWPDSTPASKAEFEKMLACNPELKLCKDVIYQWTGECGTCQGTGLVSFYRKKHEVISKCMNCLGIGSVNKITSRESIQDMDDSEDDSTNGFPGGSSSSNGKS